MSDADYYQAHKDDPAEWGDPQPAPKPSRRLAAMISVRFTPDEEQAIRAAAAAAGQSVSGFIRAAALHFPRRSRSAWRLVQPTATASDAVPVIYQQEVRSWTG